VLLIGAGAQPWAALNRRMKSFGLFITRILPESDPIDSAGSDSRSGMGRREHLGSWPFVHGGVQLEWPRRGVREKRHLRPAALVSQEALILILTLVLR